MTEPSREAVEVEKFAPDQIISSRILQRSMKEVEERLAHHGSLLLISGSRPIGVLHALRQEGRPHE